MRVVLFHHLHPLYGLYELREENMLEENWNDWNDHGQGIHPVSALDYLPVPQLRELQLRRLKAVVAR